MSSNIHIQVNHKRLTIWRRFQLARAFAWLAFMQAIGRRAQLNIYDVAPMESVP